MSGHMMQNVTSEPSSLSADERATPGVGVQTMALQPLVNRVVLGLLRTPLLCRVVGKRLVTLYIVGRKSGRHYAARVPSPRPDGLLLIGPPFTWGRNLPPGEPLDVRFMGKRR